MKANRIIPACLGLAVALGAGCSREQRTTRILGAIDRHLAAQELAAAEIECRNVLQLDPIHPGALRRLGLIYWDQGREYRAVPLLRATLRHFPDDAEARVRLARFHLACGDPAAAAGEATVVLRATPSDPEAPLILAAAAAPDPDSQRRARDLLHGLPDTASAPVLVALGVLDLRAGRVAAAEAAFHHALRTDSRFAPAHHALGMLRWGRGDLKAAEAALREAAETSRPYSPFRERYARFLLLTGNLAEAHRLAAQATADTPDHLPSWILRAECAAAGADPAAAAAHLKEALRRDEAHPAVLAALARLSLAQGDAGAAVTTLERLRALHPGLPQARYELALALLAKGETPRALTLLDEVAQAAPALREATLARAEINLRRGDPGAAAAVLEPLVREHPDLSAARALLAGARWAQGRPDDAIALCLDLERDLPSSPQAPFLRGVALAGKGRHDEARAALTRALGLAPGNTAILEALVNVEIATGRREEARRLLEKESSQGTGRLEPSLLLARVLAISGDAESAEQVLLQATRDHTRSALAHYALALLRHTRRGGGDPLSPARRALELEPRSVAAAWLVAELEQARGDIPAARAACEKTLALQPDHAGALRLLARLLLQPPADPGRALKLAEQAWSAGNDDPASAAILGTVLRRTGDSSRALPLLRLAAARAPRDAALQLELARALLSRGADPEARAAFGSVETIGPPEENQAEVRASLELLDLPADPAPLAAEGTLYRRLAAGEDDPATRARLASIALQKGQTDLALDHAQSALAAAPSHPIAALLAARILAGQGKAGRGLELLKSARAASPDHIALTRGLGRFALDHSSDHPWALSLLQDAARNDPSDPEGLYDLARALYATGDTNAALRVFASPVLATPPASRAGEIRAWIEAARRAETFPEKGSTEDPLGAPRRDAKPSTPLMWVRLRGALHADDHAAVLRISEELVRDWPHFTPGLRAAISAHRALRPPPAYLREPSLRIAADPSTPAAVRRDAGLVLCRLGEPARGASALETSLAESPTDAEALLELGRACLALGRSEDGRAYLLQTMAADPSGVEAAAARTALGGSN